MVNSLNSEERTLIIKSLTEYVNVRCNLMQHEEYIQNNFNGICKKNADNLYLEVINDFYMNKDSYVNFKKYLLDNNLSEYIRENFKKLLIVVDDDNCQYHICTSNNSTNKDNFVKNGSLVFKINRLLDYNTDIRKRLQAKKQLDEYLKKIEKEMSTILYVDVRILYDDKIIPPQT